MPDISQIEVPAKILAWIDPIIYIFLGLVLLWIVLKFIGYYMRRAYNLTPAGTAKSKNVRPDFLKVDHAQREQLIDRGRRFDEAQAPPPPPVETVTNAAKWGVLITGLISFGSAAFFSLARIEGLDEIWLMLSAWDKFVKLVQSHPAGFTIAVILIIPGLIQLISTFRRA